MTNNNTTKGNNMNNKFLTPKQTEGMSLEEFLKAMQDGKIEIRKESSHTPTREEVTMNERFGCE
jgi:hypothetical protein